MPEPDPPHPLAQPARVTAETVANSVLAETAIAYPEPMRHASGGFRRTLRNKMVREVERASLRWADAASRGMRADLAPGEAGVQEAIAEGRRLVGGRASPFPRPAPARLEGNPGGRFDGRCVECGAPLDRPRILPGPGEAACPVCGAPGARAPE